MLNVAMSPPIENDQSGTGSLFNGLGIFFHRIPFYSIFFSWPEKSLDSEELG